MRKTRARYLVTVRKNTAQLVWVTLLTGQQSGAAPCRCSDGSTSPSLLKSTVHAVKVQTGGLARLCSLSVLPCLPLKRRCRTQPAGRSVAAAARKVQRHKRAKRGRLTLMARGVDLKLHTVLYNLYYHPVSSREAPEQKRATLRYIT